MQKLKMSFFHLLESLFTCFLKDKTLHNHWDYAGFTVPYYNIPSNNRELQPVLRQALLDYKNTGEDVYFEMQITNDDPTSDAGRQTIIFYDCNTDGGVLAKFDADGEYLDEEIEGTFEDFSMPESFANLTGFLTN